MAQGSTARKPVGQQIAFIRKTISGANGNVTNTVGILPAGAAVLRISTIVRTVFSGGTPTISFGPSSSGAAWFALTGAPVTTLGRNPVTLLGVASLYQTADTTVVAVQAGTPTAGDADVEIEYTTPDETP